METGLRKKGLLSFIRELDGNDEDRCETYLKDASMYARGKYYTVISLYSTKFKYIIFMFRDAYLFIFFCWEKMDFFFIKKKNENARVWSSNWFLFTSTYQFARSTYLYLFTYVLCVRVIIIYEYIRKNEYQLILILNT